MKLQLMSQFLATLEQADLISYLRVQFLVCGFCLTRVDFTLSPHQHVTEEFMYKLPIIFIS